MLSLALTLRTVINELWLTAFILPNVDVATVITCVILLTLYNDKLAARRFF